MMIAVLIAILLLIVGTCVLALADVERVKQGEPGAAKDDRGASSDSDATMVTATTLASFSDSSSSCSSGGSGSSDSSSGSC